MNKKKIIFLLVLIFIISFCLTIVLVNKNKSTEEITQQDLPDSALTTFEEN